MKPLILGLNTNHGDSAAALVGAEGPIAAIAEERISRQKHSAAFPAGAISWALGYAGVKAQELSGIAIARDPGANLPQKLAYMARYPVSSIERVRSRFRVHTETSSVNRSVAKALNLAPNELDHIPLFRTEHHLAHAASAFYWSPFEAAQALTIDGAGDFCTSLWADCKGTDLKIRRKTYWPHSLGVFYTAICQLIGFERYGEEFKVMGLSAYGKPSHMRMMRRLVRFDSKRGIRLNLEFFQHHRQGSLEELDEGQVRLPRLFSPSLVAALGAPRRREEELTDFHRDLAASMQLRYEEILLEIVRDMAKQSDVSRLVMAGGCALNSVANGRLLEDGLVKEIFFQPAASDDGTAVGAAQHALHTKLGLPRAKAVRSAYLGPEWSDQALCGALETQARPFKRLERSELLDRAVNALAQGKILGWFQGREEWGPRALGNRSILCNPAWPGMKATLNARIKNREPFRPFAPVVQLEDLSSTFEGRHEVPFMVVVYRVRPEWRERLSAITHADNTGRVQTVTREDNALYYDLIGAFKERTGVPALLNTSFNENEPIVHLPEHAVACFERTQMDCLALGPYWLEKSRPG